MDAGEALLKLLGGLLLAVGSIVALSCGLCTGYVGLFSIASLFNPKDRDTITFTGPFLLAGLVATAVGVGVAWGGIAMLRRSSGPGGGAPTDRGE